MQIKHSNTAMQSGKPTTSPKGAAGLRVLFFSAALAMMPLAVQAADAVTQLRQFINTVTSASGSFVQEQSSDQRRTSSQSGVFSFERPGKFRWDVQKPYEQLTISDGKRLYQYDPDLAQVTERSVDASVGASPAAILFGSGSFDESFVAASLPDADNMQWMRATPKQGDAGFEHVDIGFRDGMPARLMLLDAFGQTTRIDLGGIQSNPTLPADAFQFQAPEGTDVVRMP